ncbi:MAG TPA: N-terminal phage integrase SAM-like domain-containing protein, partial [Bryobacteraceae bacterium]|nr:N-terminal phage integrase SAM-like domain-containing protein [Bryobacteraceae bacterium]
MAPINAGKLILQAQIPFSQLAEKYREARLPKLSAAARERYESQIENHILPVFGKAELADIDRQSIEAWLNRESAAHDHIGKDGESRKFEALGWWSLWSLRGIMSAIFTAAIE